MFFNYLPCLIALASVLRTIPNNTSICGYLCLFPKSKDNHSLGCSLSCTVLDQNKRQQKSMLCPTPNMNTTQVLGLTNLSLALIYSLLNLKHAIYFHL